jgi:SNARE associated Golgi protein
VAPLSFHNLVYRYGRFIRLTPERLDKAEHWLKKHGSRAVFLGRLLPGLRIITAVACGVFQVPLRIFMPAMALGALAYILVYTLLGYFLGQPVLYLLEQIHLPFGLLGSLIPLTLIVGWTIRARQGLGRRAVTAHTTDHHQQLRDGAISGTLATIASTLLLNVVINLAGNIAFNAPGTIVEQTAARLAFAFAREVQPGLLFLAVPAFLVVGVLWGALYGLFFEPMLPTSMPDTIKGLCFAIVPFATSALVAMPLLGLGFFGVGATGPVAVVGEIIRHGAYGIVVGLVYPVMRARRPVRVLPHTPDEVAPNAALSA